MHQTGALVAGWPFTPGCEASGVIVKVGSNATSALGNMFKEGDKVFGCVKVGTSGFTCWGEYVRVFYTIFYSFRSLKDMCKVTNSRPVSARRFPSYSYSSKSLSRFSIERGCGIADSKSGHILLP